MKKILLFLIFILLIGCINQNYTLKIIKTDDKGNVLERIFYNGDKEIAHLYFDNNENLIKDEGKIPDGIFIKCFDKGKLQSETTYKNNKLDGLSKIYYESGKLQQTMIYKEGKGNGLLVNYSENGKVQAEANFVNNLQDGITKIYNENGKIKYEIIFRNGEEVVGTLKEYDEKGNLKKTWIEVYTFKGNDLKKSPVFELTGNNARIKYKYQALSGLGMGMFSVYVLEEGKDLMKDGGIPDLMTTVEKEESESSIQKLAGRYYLTVNATGTWTVTVEEER